MEQVEHPRRAVGLWRDSGALRALLPAIEGVSPGTLHTLDHLPRATGKRASQRKMLRLVALFGELSPREAEKTARKLRFSNQQIAWIRAVVEHAGRVQAEIAEAHAAATEISPTQIRKWIAFAGRTRMASVIRLVAARFAAQRELGHPAPPAAAMTSLYRRVLRSAFHEPVELSDLAIGGDELRGAGVAEGPEMGWVLHRLLDVVLEDPGRNTVEDLLRLAAELLKRYRTGER
jgi:tRNA nucleotidyltransferase (CCA-adding enzyme)